MTQIRPIGYNVQDFQQSGKLNEVIRYLNPLLLTNDNFFRIAAKSDLPSPDNGVITLEDYATYYFIDDIDLTGDRIVCGVNTVILGTSSENARILSTGLTDPLITSQYSLPIRNITLEAETIFDLDGDALTTALDWQAVNLQNSSNIGRIANYTNFIMQDSAVFNSGNMVFDETFGTVGFNGCLFIPAEGTAALKTLPTTSINRRFRVIYSAITVIGGGRIGVDFSTSTTVPDEAYILDTVSFGGGGIYINGITTSSNKALFSNCTGIENTANRGFMYMVNNVTPTDIITQNVWVKAVGTSSPSPINSKFSHSPTRLTYTGAFTQSFTVQVNSSLSCGSPNQVLSIAIAKNGVVIPESELTARASTAGQQYPVGTSYPLLLATNDYIELFVKNNTGTADITVEDFNMTINKIPA